MAIKNSNDTRIIMMSPALMRLYNVTGLWDETANQAITFCDPEECLNLMIDIEAEENVVEVEELDSKALRLEKQWGELELRLSFFTEALKWQ